MGKCRIIIISINRNRRKEPAASFSVLPARGGAVFFAKIPEKSKIPGFFPYFLRITARTGREKFLLNFFSISFFPKYFPKNFVFFDYFLIKFQNFFIFSFFGSSMRNKKIRFS